MIHDDETARSTSHQTPPEPSRSETRPIASNRGLNRQTQTRLGVHLRAMYDAVVQQPIPSRFTDLIAQLGDGPTVRETTSGCGVSTDDQVDARTSVDA